MKSALWVRCAGSGRWVIASDRAPAVALPMFAVSAFDRRSCVGLRMSSAAAEVASARHSTEATHVTMRFMHQPDYQENFASGRGYRRSPRRVNAPEITLIM